ncbi:MAG: hypothetical protein LBB49_02975, partial [Gracilibacteraceae bacterium]|nr:hypothetical protein [Gracilibacteraceae bacterium]
EIELEAAAKRDPMIKEAVARLVELSADEKTRLLYEAREKERMDNESRADWARTEGEKAEREKWQGVVAEKDSRIAELEAQLLKYKNE